MACTTDLTNDILYDCADKPKKGIEGSAAVVINYEDIDFSASTVTGAKITALTLKAGKTGFALQWYKDLASANSSYSKNNEEEDGFLHNFLGRLATTTATHAESANELKNGRFIVVYESKYKGTDSAEAFKVRGWENGLTLGEMTENTLENSGSILFTLSTEEGEYEKYPYNTVLETDYATTKASFDSLFAQA